MDYLFFIPAIFLFAVWLPNGQLLTVIEETVSLTQCESLHLGYLFLAQRCLGGVGSLQLIERPVGFDDNVMIHLATHPKLQKILSSDLHPIFTKSESTPKTVIPWDCGGLWAYLIECKILRFKTLVFVHKLTWFKSFLKMGKILQINQKVYNSIHSQPLGLNSTSINATFRLENFRSFTMSRYPWLKGLSHYSQRLQCTKYINSLALLLGSSYASKKSCWTQNLKLQTLGYL